MPLPIIGDLITAGLKIIDKVIPDPQAKLNAQTELLRLQQTGELAALAAETQLSQGQIDINKIEASSANLFISGWRPAIGWVCVLALASKFFFVPLLAWAGSIWGGWPPPPALDLGDLIGLLFAMLGMGTLRTFEKKMGVAA